jgi:hypothetical protein
MRTSGPDSIITHLGGQQLLASLGARNFLIDDTHVSFTLIHDTLKGAHSVAISIEPEGDFTVTCYGRIAPGSLQAPVLGTRSVAIPENLAEVVGELAGIDILKHRHF